ncbi:MAG: hypothetical protein QOG67_3650 [Verrucomicrobiota bacterium]|jgi:hypothetical protein
MRLSAPGNVGDFETDLQRQKWSDHLSREIDDAISGIRLCAHTPQYVNPAKVDVAGYKPNVISWPGFPNLLFGQYATADEAYAAADASTTFEGDFGPVTGRGVQDEYLEWYVTKDAAGNVRTIDFTTETQEYWSTLYSLSPDLAARKYTQILGTNVTVADISTNHRYNPYNDFNVKTGIIHLIQGNNTLGAELDIAAQSTLPRTDATGNPITDVVSCSHCTNNYGLGEAGRNSDPTIASNVALAAQNGCLLTVPDPVGLYIVKFDADAIAGPIGVNVRSCWTEIRGNPTVRARFTIPVGHTLGQFSVGGNALQHPSQIAEHIFVGLTAVTETANAVQRPPPRLCSAQPAAPLRAMQAPFAAFRGAAKNRRSH